MLFVLLFLILTATGAYLLPEWSLASVALGAFASVLALRLILAILPKKAAGKGS